MYMWSDEWVGEDGTSEEMAECVGVPASACSHLRATRTHVFT